jgi:hypothetical protein
VLLLVVTAAFPRVPCPGLNDAGPQRLELVGAIVASETGDAGATLPFKYITWESHTHRALTLNKPLVRARVCVCLLACLCACLFVCHPVPVCPCHRLAAAAVPTDHGQSHAWRHLSDFLHQNVPGVRV